MPPVTSAASHRAFVIGYAIWIFGIFSYFVPAATWSPVSRFSLTRAIVENHSLRIDGFEGASGDRALHGAHWYSDKAPVPSLLATPVYAVFHQLDRLRGTAPRFSAVGTEGFPARRVYVNGPFQRGLYVCSLATAGLAGTVLTLLLYELARRRVGERGAFAASALGVLATPIFPYATSFYGHVVAGAFLVGAVAALELGKAPPGAPRRRRLAGACLALAIGSEYILLFPAALVAGLVVLGSKRRLRTLYDLGLGALVPVAVVAAYHSACFGAPWRTGYSFIARSEFAAGHASGLLGVHAPQLSALGGLLVGPRRGLFFVAPVAAIGLYGLGRMLLRERDTAARTLAAAGALLFVLNAGYYMWWGGAATGPRHLVPALGVVALGLGGCWSRPGLRAAALVLAVPSLAFMLVLTAVGLEAPERGNVLFDYALGGLREGRIAHLSGASNLGIQLGLHPAATLGPILVWMLVGARVLWNRLEPS